MQLSLIICTYMRAQPLLNLLESVYQQELIPNEIIIVDGSTNNETKEAIEQHNFHNLHYYLVDAKDRGLTRQRNFGIAKVNETTDVVCFLDDDTILEKEYFKEICIGYEKHPEALSIGGFITNEVVWEPCESSSQCAFDEYFFDGWKRKDGSRFLMRKRLGLDTDKDPCWFPDFAHGRSTSFLPPSGKIYEVEHLMGGVSSFRKEVFETLQFSTYFEGYGLYEDADFTLRLSKIGKLYINTSARLAHYHNESGRPNKYQYGKMVVRNGWYVWRIKIAHPSVKNRIKWHTITLVLTLIRFTNSFTSQKKYEAFTESMGRLSGWFGLIFNPPKLEK
jgi:glycosyltransferase involved in cell wall biosynthesis